jgi:hypothetical protein
VRRNPVFDEDGNISLVVVKARELDEKYKRWTARLTT